MGVFSSKNRDRRETDILTNSVFKITGLTGELTLTSGSITSTRVYIIEGNRILLDITPFSFYKTQNAVSKKIVKKYLYDVYFTSVYLSVKTFFKNKIVDKNLVNYISRKCTYSAVQYIYDKLGKYNANIRETDIDYSDEGKLLRELLRTDKLYRYLRIEYLRTDI